MALRQMASAVDVITACRTYSCVSESAGTPTRAVSPIRHTVTLTLGHKPPNTNKLVIETLLQLSQSVNRAIIPMQCRGKRVATTWDSPTAECMQAGAVLCLLSLAFSLGATFGAPLKWPPFSVSLVGVDSQGACYGEGEGSVGRCKKERCSS